MRIISTCRAHVSLNALSPFAKREDAPQEQIMKRRLASEEEDPPTFNWREIKVIIRIKENEKNWRKSARKYRTINTGSTYSDHTFGDKLTRDEIKTK